MNIKIFSVGGTIDKVYFDRLSEYQVGFPSVREILDGLPIAFEYEVESLLRKDSLEMDDADRELVLAHIAADPNSKILITHGTDTMIDTARKLSAVKNKCIVLTGAMEPAHFKSSDAVFNVGVAVGAVARVNVAVALSSVGTITSTASVSGGQSDPVSR